ncbi:4-diphosphocytidyl-2C-methyl-D-erythritol synthase [Bacteroidales bacterium]|nr:4-diphosphocytidyl-2C-methyl-D-erythritol synthase [Bacteroidales bacterium]
MRKYVIIVAAGQGMRMGTPIAKQFLRLGSKPVLMHSIEAFAAYDREINIILVLPKDQQDYWQNLCRQYAFTIAHQVVDGGDTRFYSVQNGLRLLDENAIVAVHDGVRPLVSKQVIGECFAKAQSEGAAYPTLSVVDSMRQRTKKGSKMVNRADYFLVQTPQVFIADLLKKAYQQDFSPAFTDDVSVYEASTKRLAAQIEGNRENIKITCPSDMAMAEKLIKHA